MHNYEALIHPQSEIASDLFRVVLDNLGIYLGGSFVGTFDAYTNQTEVDGSCGLMELKSFVINQSPFWPVPKSQDCTRFATYVGIFSLIMCVLSWKEEDKNILRRQNRKYIDSLSLLRFKSRSYAVMRWKYDNLTLSNAGKSTEKSTQPHAFLGK